MPEIYYRRRRAAALGILVLVVLILALLLSRCGGPDEENTAATESVQTSTTTATETSSSSSESSSESSSSESESSSEEATSSSTEPSAEAAAGEQCDLGSLELVATSSASTYAAGQQPTFYLTLRNPTQADCTINLDETPITFEVFNLVSDDRVWADTDCNAPVAQGDITLAAGQERYYQAIWSRTTSAPELCTERNEVEPGAYYLNVSIGDTRSAPHTFNLT